MPNDEKNKQHEEKEQKKTEIEPLSDQALEDVSGGAAGIVPDSSDGCCSCTTCSS